MGDVFEEAAFIGDRDLMQERVAAAVTATDRRAVGRLHLVRRVAIAAKGIVGKTAGIQEGILRGLAMEAEIADLIVRGLSLKEIASLKGRDGTDIRQALKSLLAKTLCKHQVELVRLIMTLCPPIRRA